MRFKTSESDGSAGGRSNGGGGEGAATRSLGNGGDLLVAAYGPHQLGVRIDPGLVWYLPAGAATEASFYTLLTHAGLSSPAMKRV